MRSLLVVFMLIGLSITKINAMNPNHHINGDTLTLKGKIVLESMENKKGQKLEGLRDFYFSSTTDSYFVKIAGSKYSRKELEAFENKEVTIRCIKKSGNIDIDSEDPSYAQTRVGEYILILEIIGK